MNSYNPNWGSQNWGTPSWDNRYSTPQSNTNKIYVTSLDDALSRPAPRGSEMVYFHQDANEFYVVKTDVDGRKSWMGFTYLVPRYAHACHQSRLQRTLRAYRKTRRKRRYNRCPI